MAKLTKFIRHWLTIARMSSTELAATTLPAWVLNTLDFKREVQKDYIGLIAAGVAFYFLLAAFPALAAIVSLYGLFMDPHHLAEQFSMLKTFLPPQALDIIINQATALTTTADHTLGISLFVSVAVTLYSATRGVNSLISGFNIAYDAQEKRGMVKLALVSYGLTALLLVYFLLSLLLVAGLPVAVRIFPLPASIAGLISTMRWPMLFGMALVGLEILYTFGPCRRRRHIRISAGAVAATLLWIGGSSLFSLFISNFTDYNETYGSLGAVVILMLWFWVSALTILIGAEINGHLEKLAEKSLA